MRRRRATVAAVATPGDFEEASASILFFMWCVNASGVDISTCV